MFRYSQFDQYGQSPSGTIGSGFDHVLGHNYIGHWTHTYSPTTFSDVYFGRNYGYSLIGTSWAGENAAFLSQLKTLGMSSAWMTLEQQDIRPPNSSGHVCRSHRLAAAGQRFGG